jgi:hypothetical protein
MAGLIRRAWLPVQAVYTALKETEHRATDVLPLWKLPVLAPLIPRQRRAAEAVALIRAETERLIAKCRSMVDAEEQARQPVASSGSPGHPRACLLRCLSCLPQALSGRASASLASGMRRVITRAGLSL